MLKLFAFRSQAVYNGKDAVDLMEKECKKRKNCCKSIVLIVENNFLAFKLILMDINMPIMDGVESTKILKSKMKKQELPETTIIACTA